MVTKKGTLGKAYKKAKDAAGTVIAGAAKGAVEAAAVSAAKVADKQPAKQAGKKTAKPTGKKPQNERPLARPQVPAVKTRPNRKLPNRAKIGRRSDFNEEENGML
jgi:hypothetical protein